jgi:TMEM175 potassium channel family protein
MTTNRLEAFSDGVIAIVITIMVLELRVPHGDTFAVLRPVFPALLSYILSFVYLGIYWNNHHHMFHAVDRVNGTILWANLHLLFWLSLVPAVTGWMGENHLASTPTALYGIVLLMAAIAWWILQYHIIKLQGPDSLLKNAIGKAWKEKVSPALYLIAIVAAFRFPWFSQSVYALVALLWLVPDKRIERALRQLEQ